MRRTPRACLRILGPIVLISILPAFWTDLPAAGWDIEIVQGTDREIGGLTSLAYDAAGNPSILYTDGLAKDTRLAVRTGGSWSVETIDATRVIVGQLAYDPGGNPSAAYTTNAGGKFDLIFAIKNGTNWDVEVVKRGVSANAVSLAYGPDGNATVAFSNNNRMQLATRVGNVWDVQVVEAQIHVGSEISLAFDPTDGRPSVVYGIPDDDLTKFAKWNGASWDIEAVETTPDNIRHLALAYDPISGKATVVFQQATAGEFDSARRLAPANWQIETIGPGGGASVAYNASGTPYVSYRNSAADQLLVAHHDGTTWSSEIVETSSAVYWTTSAVAIDVAGNPSVSYTRRVGSSGPRDLRFASMQSACSVNADCDDSNDCTLDSCDTGSGDCLFAAVADNSSCGGSGFCCGATCVNATCSSDAECSDGDACSSDVCMNPGTCAASCENIFPVCGPADGCCSPGCDSNNDPDCPDTCVPTHNNEKGPRCSDGIDNDCDGLIDGDDPDCG